MESVVPEEIRLELTQILSNLVLGDNEIRSNAEKAVNERLGQTPELYLLALAQFAIVADTDVMRSFSLVLLRRLLFRSAPSALYDHLSSQTLATLERLLLHTLANEPHPKVRRNAIDTVCDVANASMARGRPWHALQTQSFAMATSIPDALARASAFAVFAGAPNLVLDLEAEVVCGVFRGGLGDTQSVEVRSAAMRGAVAYLEYAEHPAPALLETMLGTLSAGAGAGGSYHHLSIYLGILTPLCASRPALFAPHLQGLMHVLSPLIIPMPDPGPTPTLGRPFPTSTSSSPSTTAAGEDDERQTLRLSALEFMISLSEARPRMVGRVQGWVDVLVRACLEGMGEIEEEHGWLADDPSTAADIDSPPALYEQSLDRLAIALGGRVVLPPAFQYIPSMLASYDWRVRHAGLMAIAAIGEGTGKVMQEQLGKVVELVTPMFGDVNPRVRYAACQCVGQLCTDLEEIIQEQYHAQLFSVLIPALEDPEPRVHAHASAALINFCEGVARDTLLPYLDALVERLMRLLSAPTSGRRYVREQAITTLAMVADASEGAFGKHYAMLMPVLLGVLREGGEQGQGKLRDKAMECAGLVAIAVGRDVFRPDAPVLIDLLLRIQKTPTTDAQLGTYVISTWAKICQALGGEFEPYLGVVVPPLLELASASPSAGGDVEFDTDPDSEPREGWETLVMDGRTLGIRTSAIEEKCQAFETLVIYCSTLGSMYGPYVGRTMEVALAGLGFFYHEGVREACAVLVPMLLVAGKASNTLTNQMVSATLHQLLSTLRNEQDTSFLASLYKCLNDTLRVLGGASVLPKEYVEGIVEATKRQLQVIAERRRGRAAGAAGGGGEEGEEVDREEMELMEEVEEIVLEDMGRVLAGIDEGHPLLVAVSGVRELGVYKGAWGEED